jgi:chemotaxis protein methyltransferase CheR
MQLSDHDIDVLLDDLIDCYGYDFTQYSKASLRRRIERVVAKEKITDFSVFRRELRTNPAYFQQLVTEISVNVTEMFRDPEYFRYIRQHIIPQLADLPLIRIWHAGVASGEEAYAMAILLSETGLLNKSLLYATDINPEALRKAKQGVFPLSYMQQYSKNYILAGGAREFSSYYSANYNVAKFDPALTGRMIFSPHNLVSDATFNSFQLIFCRNVLIYFDKELQGRVLSLFDNSLDKNGYLVLGSKETIRFSSIAARYKQLPEKLKVWEKIK